MLLFGLKLLMLVIMKALLSFYNIDPWSIHEAWNAKDLCLFENDASSEPFHFFFDGGRRGNKGI